MDDYQLIIGIMCKLVKATMKILFLLFFLSCNSKQNIKSYIHDIEPVSISGNSNAVIEIPAGTHDKFEVSKTNGQIVQDIEQGLPRKIKYLGYPGNYGMIPKTLLPIEDGGDGDPLDVLVLGEPLEKGSIVDVRLVGVLSMLDEGEIDDKLIAVRVKNSLFSIRLSYFCLSIIRPSIAYLWLLSKFLFLNSQTYLSLIASKAAYDLPSTTNGLSANIASLFSSSTSPVSLLDQTILPTVSLPKLSHFTIVSIKWFC